MSCDDREIEERTAGADWVWWFVLDAEASDGDTSEWSNLLVEVRDRPGGEILASSQVDPATVLIDGAFPGEDGEVPAADFDAGIIAWTVPADVSAAVSSPLAVVQAWVDRGGPDEPFYTETFSVARPVAVREVGS